MRYLIDGYNLLHAMGLLCGKVGPHGLEKARLALLGRLCGELGDDARSVTVVFDASRAPPDAVEEDDYQGIHIRYALEAEADDVIETLIQREATPRQLTVVSDDHRIQQAGRRRRCGVRGCLDYLDEMESRRHSKPAQPEASLKPEGVSSAEAQHWLREFADLANDPKWRAALGPDFCEENDKIEPRP
ncbi:MAG TPA: NYN domain-containing protein [Gemmataceae bacterium]|nr:NYN domain-containing protein [Gemmataceae bacterium]